MPTPAYFDVLYKEKFNIVAGIEAETKFSWKMQDESPETKMARPEVYMLESYGKYMLGLRK